MHIYQYVLLVSFDPKMALDLIVLTTNDMYRLLI